MAQDSQTEIDRLKMEKDKLNAEKARLEAEKELLEAQRTLDALRKPVDSATQELQDKVAGAKLQKELIDAQAALTTAQAALTTASQPPNVELLALQRAKATADAQKDFATSQTDALKAKYIGTVAQGSFTGAVTREGNAGTIEATLLAANAARLAAMKITERIAKLPGVAPGGYYVFGVTEFPSFQRLINFRFRRQLIEQAFETAGVRVPAVPGREMAEAVPALIAAGLDGLSKILSFLKTDYTVGGIEAKVENSALVFSVAGALREKHKTVYTPSLYAPNVMSDGVTGVVRELAELARLRGVAESAIKLLDGEIPELKKRAAAAQDPPTKQFLLDSAAAKTTEADRKRAAAALYDAFATSLTAADSAGTVPLTAIAQEHMLDAVLKRDGNVLLVKVDYSGGGYMIKKNLLTGLGSPPMFHSGGIVVSFILLNGADGSVLDGGILPIYGGYVKAEELRGKLG